MPSPPRHPRRPLLWGLAWFVAFQVGFVVWADVCRPEVYDPEFDHRLALLRRRYAEHPDRPRLLAVGSSRLMLAFRPERLPPLRDAAGRDVLPFNFSHTSAGPVYGLLTWQRLQRRGLRPDWLVVEVAPLLLKKEWSGVYATSAVAAEVPGLWPYAGRRLLGGYLTARALPWYDHRLAFLRHAAPGWNPPPADNWLENPRLDRLGGERAQVEGRPPRPEATVRRLRHLLAEGRPLFPTFEVDPRGDRALRQTLAECRREGVHVALVLTPESPAYREHYSPRARRELDAYCRGLCREFGAALVDARDWLPEEDFSDGHHTVKAGQAAFTDRLARDFLVPWVAGRPVTPAAR